MARVSASLTGFARSANMTAEMTANTPARLTVGLLAGLCATTGCDETTEPLTHGAVRVEFLRADNEGSSPYTGTVQVVITLDYLDCLIAFYERETTWKQDGPDGFPVYGTFEDGGEGWKDRLCDGSLPDDGRGVDCTVLAIEQELEQSKHLKVTYEVTGDIENRQINFGPLPTTELAACDGTGQPKVRVGTNGAIRGLSGDGNLVWETKSFTPDQAATDQGQAIKVRAGLP